MSDHDADGNGFHVHRMAARRSSKKSRIYIGNAPSMNAKEKLLTLFREKGFTSLRRVDVKERNDGKPTFALVEFDDNIDRVVSELNGEELEGRKLKVEREKNKPTVAKKKKSSSFGGGGWSRPSNTEQKNKETISSKDVSSMVKTNNEPENKVEPNDDSGLRMKPLSELLQDYGEQDSDFKKIVVAPPVEDSSQNRLGLEGKAPIHVEFRSFGFAFGAPSSKMGWSRTQPLPLLDCRDVLPSVPPYLLRLAGLSPTIKHHYNHLPATSAVVEGLAKDVFRALREAISDDGYGHAKPLRMVIHVGSELGRHRSIVVCELGAKKLRKLLRTNENNRITLPISVGTQHPDMDRRNNTRVRAKDDDDDVW